jgi:hypothetical protein
VVNRSPAVADKSNCPDAVDEMYFLVIEQLPGTNKRVAATTTMPIPRRMRASPS